MPHNTQLLKLDKKSQPIPQHFNNDIDDYEPLNGIFGAASSHALGTIYVDKLEGSTTQTKQLPKTCVGVYVKNDGEGDIQLTVGDKTPPPIKSLESFSMLFEPFTSITVTVLTATNYRLIVAR